MEKEFPHQIFGGAMGLIAATGLVMLFIPTLGTTFGGSFVSDEYSYLLKLLVLIGSFFAIAMSWAYAKTQSFDKFEYPVLIVPGDTRHDADAVGQRHDCALSGP